MRLIQGDCLEHMKTMPDGSVDAVITDPPYGINKAEWDGKFQEWLIPEAFRVASLVAIIPGIWALGECISLMGDKYLWTLAGHKGGAMTRGRLGFTKWQPIVVGGQYRRVGADAFDFSPTDLRPEVVHPCQKPINFMEKILGRVTNPGDIILDPFMGSGTTGVACARLGRDFIGIEIDKEYFEIAQKRIEDASAQMTMELG